MKPALLVLALLCLQACGAHIDTGQADYRVAEPPAILTDADLKQYHEVQCPYGSSNCPPLNAVRLSRRYQPRSGGFDMPTPTPPQVFSIEIEQGVIGRNILEGIFFGREFGSVAEFVILANVFEFASTAGEAAQRRFLEAGQYGGTADNANDHELKLVYFASDVRRRQPFNFSNIPLMSRRAYAGRSIGIQIVIMEVDARSGPMASLLQTLARFGQQATPALPGITEVLFDLGESLAAGGSGDDTILDYRFVLSAPGADESTVQATLAPGRYVLRRLQNRRADMRWQDLMLDHNTARLYRRTAGEQFEEVRDDLYLVLNIRQYDPGTPAEEYAFQDWSTFRRALQQAADVEAGPLSTVTNNLNQLLENRRSEEWGSRLLFRWATAETHLRRYTSLFSPETNPQQYQGCRLLPDEERQRIRQLAEQQARDAVRRFLADYQAAHGATSTPAGSTQPSPDLRTAERQAVVSSVARYFMPWTAETQARFQTPSTFETAFVKTPAARDFIADAVAVAAERRVQAPGCAELISKGLALPPV